MVFREIRDLIEKHPAILFAAGIILIGLSAALFFSLNNNVETIGGTVGETTGSLVGNAVGTINGLTIDAPKGLSEGKQEGLSANDTTVYIKENYLNTGKLEVLAAGVKIYNHNKIPGYENLTEMCGNLFFSVDMAEAVVLRDDEGFIIQIPRPKVEIFMDSTKTRTLAEAKSYSFAGDALDGVEEWLNTKAKIEENLSEEITNYNDLMKQAEDAAITQVKSMLSSYNVSGKKIKSVVFKTDEEAQ